MCGALAYLKWSCFLVFNSLLLLAHFLFRICSPNMLKSRLLNLAPEGTFKFVFNSPQAIQAVRKRYGKRRQGGGWKDVNIPKWHLSMTTTVLWDLLPYLTIKFISSIHNDTSWKTSQSNIQAIHILKFDKNYNIECSLHPQRKFVHTDKFSVKCDMYLYFRRQRDSLVDWHLPRSYNIRKKWMNDYTYHWIVPICSSFVPHINFWD